MRVQSGAPGLVNMIGAQIDSVVLESIPADVQFDVAIRVVGHEEDFKHEHSIEVSLTAPDLTPLGDLQIPIHAGISADTHIAGYEVNRHLAARIILPADTEGGYDLSFALDGQPSHSHRTTMSVVLASA